MNQRQIQDFSTDNFSCMFPPHIFIPFLELERDTQISRRSNGEWIWDHHFSETGFVGCGKKKEFWGRGEEKRKWRKDIVSLKTDLTSLFIPRVYTTYYYSIYLFLIFYKNKLYFILYQMNKSNVFFFFQIIIFHYLFIESWYFSKTLFI